MPVTPALRTSDSIHHPGGILDDCGGDGRAHPEAFCEVCRGIVLGSRAVPVEMGSLVQRDEARVESLDKGSEREKIVAA